MTGCKFYNECKNQQLLWDLYAGIARDAKKASGYYGDYMRVLQRMKNVNDYLCPICGYYKECKMPTAIMDTCVSIARNVKGQRLLWDLYAGIAINAKCLWLFLDLYASIAY
jgi:hypothetical protein